MPNARDRPRHFGASVSALKLLPNRWDAAAAPIVLGALVLVAVAAGQMSEPIAAVQRDAISLEPAMLPGYALRTTLRMLIALAASLLFALVYATLAAKSRRMGAVLIPILDVLQSVPILGFLSFTVAFFLALFPGSVLGAECASIFAIFTSQAWNMTFSFYASMRLVPRDLDEVCRGFRLSPWQRFWRLEVPFAMPGLVWNAMASMAGGWFFVVASEAISVGERTIALPGVGSYLARAIDERDVMAIGWAVATMLLVILLTDQLLFRPLVAWSEQFRFPHGPSADSAQSWFLRILQRARLLRGAALALGMAGTLVVQPAARLARRIPSGSSARRRPLRQAVGRLWLAAVAVLAALGAVRITLYLSANLALADVGEALLLGSLTFLRVMVLIALASLLWVPIGIGIGLRPRLARQVQPIAQFLAAFPANLLFPLFVIGIVRFDLDPDVWLSPLMVLGTQWYILFNVVAGASTYPDDLREVARSFRLRGWAWWRRAVLPGVLPYYVTGALAASGGSWNASILAERVSWGDTQLQAAGLGAYIAVATEAGDFPRIILGISVMAVFVVLFNRLFWGPLFTRAETALRPD